MTEITHIKASRYVGTLNLTPASGTEDAARNAEPYQLRVTSYALAVACGILWILVFLKSVEFFPTLDTRHSRRHAELRAPNAERRTLPDTRHPAPDTRPSLLPTVRRYGEGVAGFLERHLARKCGALIALLSCLALTAALVTQEYVCASISWDDAGLRIADPMNATVNWLFVLANFGLSLVVIGTAAIALRRFPLAALIGMSWVLASLAAGTVYHALAMPALSPWLCGALGVGGTLIDHMVVGDEVVRTCLIFLQDVTEMIGAAMLGAVFFRLERGARAVSICAFALAVWSFFDLMISAVSTGPLVDWSDVVSIILRAFQCALSGVWFWSRSRGDSANQEGLSAP